MLNGCHFLLEVVFLLGALAANFKINNGGLHLRHVPARRKDQPVP